MKDRQKEEKKKKSQGRQKWEKCINILKLLLGLIQFSLLLSYVITEKKHNIRYECLQASRIFLENIKKSRKSVNDYSSKYFLKTVFKEIKSENYFGDFVGLPFASIFQKRLVDAKYSCNPPKVIEKLVFPNNPGMIGIEV